MEPMFDSHSFKEEITSTSEAESCYNYFTNNLTAFRHELADAGKSYEDIEKEVRQCWENLLESCQRVGYSNGHLKRMADKYK